MPEISSQRAPNESFDEARDRNLELELDSGTSAVLEGFGRQSALNAAREWPGIPAQRMTYSEIARVFRRIRDDRFLQDPEFSGYKRRISWLYPNDGCYVRAQLAIDRAPRSPLMKIFAFGRLRAQTRFTRGGKVWWWFHVAALATEWSGKLWVLDPAIEPSRPLAFTEWRERMGGDKANPKFSVCSPNTYGPSGPCDGPSNPRSAKRSALAHAPSMLRMERRNVRNLGYDPVTVLGNSPPWR